MLNRKQVPRLVSDELVQVNQTVKEDADLLIVLLQLLKGEVALLTRLDHVVHLAKQIHKQDGLMVQVLKTVHLLLIKVFHLMWCNDLIVVEIND